MQEMNIIITMGGLGSRFLKAGYKVPKYMIEARGKTMFEWYMDSLVDYNQKVCRYIFVVRKEDHAREFIMEKCKQYGFDFLGIQVHIVELDALTDGQATTAMMAIPYCGEKESIMIYNIDTYVEPGELKVDAISGEGHIPCFHADGDHWSFAKCDENGKVVEGRQKVRVSDNCTLGAYYFSSASLYKQIYEEYYADGANLEKGEKYVAPLYNYMLEKDMEVTISIIDFDKVHVLGTPEELEAFLKEREQ